MGCVTSSPNGAGELRGAEDGAVILGREERSRSEAFTSARETKIEVNKHENGEEEGSECPNTKEEGGVDKGGESGDVDNKKPEGKVKSKKSHSRSTSGKLTRIGKPSKTPSPSRAVRREARIGRKKVGKVADVELCAKPSDNLQDHTGPSTPIESPSEPRRKSKSPSPPPLVSSSSIEPPSSPEATGQVDGMQEVTIDGYDVDDLLDTANADNRKAFMQVMIQDTESLPMIGDEKEVDNISSDISSTMDSEQDHRLKLTESERATQDPTEDKVAEGEGSQTSRSDTSKTSTDKGEDKGHTKVPLYTVVPNIVVDNGLGSETAAKEEEPNGLDVDELSPIGGIREGKDTNEFQSDQPQLSTTGGVLSSTTDFANAGYFKVVVLNEMKHTPDRVPQIISPLQDEGGEGGGGEYINYASTLSTLNSELMATLAHHIPAPTVMEEREVDEEEEEEDNNENVEAKKGEKEKEEQEKSDRDNETSPTSSTSTSPSHRDKNLSAEINSPRRPLSSHAISPKEQHERNKVTKTEAEKPSTKVIKGNGDRERDDEHKKLPKTKSETNHKRQSSSSVSVMAPLSRSHRKTDRSSTDHKEPTASKSTPRGKHKQPSSHVHQSGSSNQSYSYSYSPPYSYSGSSYSYSNSSPPSKESYSISTSKESSCSYSFDTKTTPALNVELDLVEQLENQPGKAPRIISNPPLHSNSKLGEFICSSVSLESGGSQPNSSGETSHHDSCKECGQESFESISPTLSDVVRSVREGSGVEVPKKSSGSLGVQGHTCGIDIDEEESYERSGGEAATEQQDKHKINDELLVAFEGMLEGVGDSREPFNSKSNKEGTRGNRLREISNTHSRDGIESDEEVDEPQDESSFLADRAGTASVSRRTDPLDGVPVNLPQREEDITEELIIPSSDTTGNNSLPSGEEFGDGTEARNRLPGANGEELTNKPAKQTGQANNHVGSLTILPSHISDKEIRHGEEQMDKGAGGVAQGCLGENRGEPQGSERPEDNSRDAKSISRDDRKPAQWSPSSPLSIHNTRYNQCDELDTSFNGMELGSGGEETLSELLSSMSLSDIGEGSPGAEAVRSGGHTKDIATLIGRRHTTSQGVTPQNPQHKPQQQQQQQNIAQDKRTHENTTSLPPERQSDTNAKWDIIKRVNSRPPAIRTESPPHQQTKLSMKAQRILSGVSSLSVTDRYFTFSAKTPQLSVPPVLLPYMSEIDRYSNNCGVIVKHEISLMPNNNIFVSFFVRAGSLYHLAFRIRCMDNRIEVYKDVCVMLAGVGDKPLPSFKEALPILMRVSIAL